MPAIDDSTYPVRMEAPVDGLYLLAARVEAGLSRLTRTVFECVSSDRAVDLSKLLGNRINILVDTPDDAPRAFPGICTEIEFVGTEDGPARYRGVLRPCFWFLTRRRDSRIFQDLSVPDLIKKILGDDYGFTSQLQDRLSGSYEVREYVVQYRESDFDFLSRLMEEEGIYYYFTDDGSQEQMVLADGASSHDAVAGGGLPFVPLDQTSHRQVDHVYEWLRGHHATTGKWSLDDFDFTKPTADLTSARQMPKGQHSHKNYEAYDYPGHFRDTGLGSNRARVRMEAEAARHDAASARSNACRLGCGTTFTMKDHPRTDENSGYLVTRVTHTMSLTGQDDPPFGIADPSDPSLAAPEHMLGHYEAAFDAIPEAEQYRAPLNTPWPEIAGVQTATVVGKKGEEIDVDKYGRVLLQFHWDRLGKKDENSSCRVRVMMPWTGKQWGMIHHPRLGQEVVVQFEEGDPDRPLVVGMLYNADTMPPYGLPGAKTQSGMVSRSTKSGSASTFHELMFEDKKGEELIRFQSERDYRQIVKNDAEITVGLEHKDKGDMSLEVHRHLSETLNTGDHSFKVAAGSQTIDIKKDKTETIEGKSTQTITQDVTQTVTQGSVTQTLEMGGLDQILKAGALTRTLDMGSYKTRLKMGAYNLLTDLGAIDVEAKIGGIELKCGPSSIKIDLSGVTIKGPMVKIEGAAMLEAKAPMTTVKGDAMLILKGGVTMVN